MTGDAEQLRRAAAIDETVTSLVAYVLDHRIAISADMRVSERDAAAMLRLAPSYLKALRLAGDGPTNYALGVDGSRYSYRLRDLAGWVEMARDAIAR